MIMINFFFQLQPMTFLMILLSLKLSISAYLHKRRSTTGIFLFTYMGDTIIYKFKIQLITAGSLTKAEFIAAYSTVKLAWYLKMLLKQLGYK